MKIVSDAGNCSGVTLTERLKHRQTETMTSYT